MKKFLRENALRLLLVLGVLAVYGDMALQVNTLNNRVDSLVEDQKTLATVNLVMVEALFGADANLEDRDDLLVSYPDGGILGQVEYLDGVVSTLTEEPAMRHYIFVENAQDELDNLALPESEREEGLLHGSWSDYYGLMPYWTAEAGLTKEAAEEARLSAKIYRRAKDLGWVDTDRGEYEGLSDLSRPQSVSGHN